MLNLGNSPKMPEKEKSTQTLSDALSQESSKPIAQSPNEPVHTVPNIEVQPQGEQEGIVEPLSRVVDEKVGKPVTVTPIEKPKSDGKPTVKPTATDGDDNAPRAGGISLVGIIQSNINTVRVFKRGIYYDATSIAGYILRNDGVEELEVFDDVLVPQTKPNIVYQQNTSLLSTAKDLKSVPKVPFAIGETRYFTKPALLALNESCKEIGSRIGIGEALPVVVSQLMDLHPELTEEVATDIAKDFKFAIQVREARGEGILVPENPEGLFSRLSVALGLALSPETLKEEVARQLLKNKLVTDKTPEELLLMLKDRLNLALPQGLLLPVDLFEETFEVKGAHKAVKGSKVKPEFERVFGVYNEYNQPKSKRTPRAQTPKSDKETKGSTKLAVSSQVNLANYFAHYTQGK
jgi:hypothetical protein